MGFGYGSVHGIFYAWAQTDPAGAAAKAMQLPGRERDQALSSIAAQWATKDVNGALAWVQGLPESNAKRNAVRTVLGELANQDPQAAAQFALNLTGAGRQEAIKIGRAHV